MSDWITGDALETVVRLRAIEPGDELLHRTRGVCVVESIDSWPEDWPAEYVSSGPAEISAYQIGDGAHPDGRRVEPDHYEISWGLIDGWRRPVKP